MNIPDPWLMDTADISRDERKRKESPGSFFYSQGKSIVLASGYFHDDRLKDFARGGVARKHRHRIHLALFGQLMASFEYLSKEIVAKAVDVTDYLDLQLDKCGWVRLSSAHVLATRRVATTPGSILIGPTQGWHSAEAINERYRFLFGSGPIDDPTARELDRLWVLRHSVAHNAGFVTNHDSARISAPALSERVVAISESFIEEAFDFLSPIGETMVQVAGNSLLARLRTQISLNGKSYPRDESYYIAIKRLSQYVKSRTRGLADFGEVEYDNDFP